MSFLKAFALFLLGLLPFHSQAQDSDHLSAEEIAAAQAAPQDTGRLILSSWTPEDGCGLQRATVAVFTPAGMVNTLAWTQKKQYLPVEPVSGETIRRVFRVFTAACVGNSASGPTCNQITRAVLVPDKTGAVVAEAKGTTPTENTFTDSNGISSKCADLFYNFSIPDLQRARNPKGEFTIVLFSGTSRKDYVIKGKDLKKLGL